MKTFADIFAKWDTAAALGADIGVSDMHARAMKRRDSIPPEYWPQLVSAAHKRGVDEITIERLALMRASRRSGPLPKTRGSNSAVAV